MEIGYVVHTTVDDEDDATKLGEALVRERLCACAQVVPGITSFYLWQNKVERSREFLVLLKTTPSNLEPLMSRLKSLHPYDVPEILANPVTRMDNDYRIWMEENLGT